eukprot:TRINITY_DN127_c2_g5_i1.p3 TRINITY_DN127_c2_g5~~TRINITY_DN127_c2_g5_i1.p3  ORF type:complete len:411 (+),score=104.89 TRINITY_DN127_c2_g5_i1:67-1233(+)
MPLGVRLHRHLPPARRSAGRAAESAGDWDVAAPSAAAPAARPPLSARTPPAPPVGHLEPELGDGIAWEAWHGPAAARSGAVWDSAGHPPAGPLPGAPPPAARRTPAAGATAVGTAGATAAAGAGAAAAAAPGAGAAAGAGGRGDVERLARELAAAREELRSRDAAHAAAVAALREEYEEVVAEREAELRAARRVPRSAPVAERQAAADGVLRRHVTGVLAATRERLQAIDGEFRDRERELLRRGEENRALREALLAARAPPHKQPLEQSAAVRQAAAQGVPRGAAEGADSAAARRSGCRPRARAASAGRHTAEGPRRHRSAPTGLRRQQPPAPPPWGRGGSSGGAGAAALAVATRCPQQVPPEARVRQWLTAPGTQRAGLRGGSPGSQ